MTQFDAPVGAAASRPRFLEPTRRHALRFGDYSGRYGASLVAILLGSYLLMNSNFGQAVSSIAFGREPEIAVLFGSQFLFAVVVVVFGIAVAPATAVRRLAAGAVVVVLAILLAVITGVSMTSGAIPVPIRYLFVPVGVGAFAGAIAWLILRERPVFTFLFPLALVLVPVFNWVLALANVGYGIQQLVVLPLAAILAIGSVWIAKAIAGGFSHRVGAAPEGYGPTEG